MALVAKYVAVIGVLLGVSALAQTSPEAKNSAITLRGRVVNSVTGEPIGHAVVASPDNRFGTFTDDQGHFEFTLPKQTGTDDTTVTTFAARKPGYLQSEDEPLAVASSDGREITLSLQPESLIVGRVVSADAPESLRVGLYRKEVREGRGFWAPVGDRGINAEGEFRFAGLRPGSYRLFTYEAVDRDPQDIVPGGPVFGYPPVYYPAASDFDSSAVISLTAGRTFHTELRLIKKQYFEIRIPIANESNNQVQVTVRANGSSGPGFSLGYSQLDHAIRGRLPSGNYVVEASSFPPMMDGTLNLTVNGPVFSEPMTLRNSRTIPVEVTTEFLHPDEQQVKIFTRISPLKLENSVSSVSLDPIDGLGYPAGLRPQKRQDDAIELENVRPGRYWVRVDPRHGYIARITSGGVDLLEHPYEVRTGVPNEAIEITLRDGFADIEGVVDGSPAASGTPSVANFAGGFKPYAFVYCVPLEPSARFVEIGTSPNGALSGIQIPPGLYRVMAFKTAQRHLEYHDPAFLKSIESKGIVVRLVDDGKEKVRVPLVGDLNP